MRAGTQEGVMRSVLMAAGGVSMALTRDVCGPHGKWGRRYVRTSDRLPVSCTVHFQGTAHLGVSPTS